MQKFRVGKPEGHSGPEHSGFTAAQLQLKGFNHSAAEPQPKMKIIMERSRPRLRG